jgi:hypothetical protein
MQKIRGGRGWQEGSGARKEEKRGCRVDQGNDFASAMKWVRQQISLQPVGLFHEPEASCTHDEATGAML